MLYFQWRSGNGSPAWLVLCLVLSLVLPEAEFTECYASALAGGLPDTDCDFTSALQVSVEIVRGPVQPQQQQQKEQQQQQQQQQLQFQGPTTVALPAAITWATASTNHRGSVSASGIPLPTPTPTLQAQAVTPCLGDQRNDLRQKDWPCQHPPGATVSPAESAVRQRTSRVPQSQELGPTALPMRSASNTSSSSERTWESASWLISSTSLERAEAIVASTVNSGSATLLILAFILIVLGVGIVLFAGQARDQRQLPTRRPVLPGNHSTNMGTSISRLPSQRNFVTGPLPPSMIASGRQSIGQPRPFPPDTTSSMPPPFRSQPSVNWKPPGSSSMPPIHSQPGQSSLSPWQLTQTALSSHGLEQRIQLCEPGAAWSHIDLYFKISTDVLQSIADSDEATGAFEVWRGGGGTPEPVFAASVLPWGSSPRALVMYAVGTRGELLASCAPSVVNSGSELEIRDQDSRVWGTLSPQGSDTYAVFQGRGRRVLNMLGNQDTGHLMVKLGEEIVAHAAHNGPKKQVEIGVKPQIDPVLMLICVLAVLIFNPEEP